MSDASASGPSPPHRHLDKREAIRHLLHAAIRLLIKQEDPFAIHLVIQSADKLLADLAEKRGIEMTINLRSNPAKDELSKFLKDYRKTYNYLKHANRDCDDRLPIHNIMVTNLKLITSASINYATLFGEITHHMASFLIFIHALLPDAFSRILPAHLRSSEAFRRLIEVNMDGVQEITPQRLFEWLKEIFPSLETEAADDLRDIAGFYDGTLASLRAGIKRRRPPGLVVH